MILTILAIGLLNVGVGFGLAIYLGYGPPGLMEAWEALCADLPRTDQDRGPGERTIMIAEESRSEPAMIVEAGPGPEIDVDHAAADSIADAEFPAAESSAAGLGRIDPPASVERSADVGREATAMESELLDEITELGAAAEQAASAAREPSAVAVHAGA